MSILVVEVLPQGLVFAADRNVTISKKHAEKTFYNQKLGTKILKWPLDRAILGYVGKAQIHGRPTSDWLYDFIGDHVKFQNPENVARSLQTRLQEALGKDHSPRALIVEFGAFSKVGTAVVPQIWHVANVHGISEKGYDRPTSHVGCSEQLLGNHLKEIAPGDLRTWLTSAASQLQPFWFHQGFELAVFNTMEQAMKSAFRALHQHGLIKAPKTLADWENYARMWVLMYGSFFEAFRGPGERFVGGGADVLSIPWPD